MARPRNFLLAVLVLACLASIWLSRGKPLPEVLSGRNEETPVLDESDLSLADEPIHLRVLNGTAEPGLAADMALLIPRLGCVVEGLGNAPTWPGGPTVLVNRRLPADRAEALAALLGGIPVLREWDGRATEDAVLVLGEDHPRLRNLLKTVQR